MIWGTAGAGREGSRWAGCAYHISHENESKPAYACDVQFIFDNLFQAFSLRFIGLRWIAVNNNGVARCVDWAGGKWTMPPHIYKHLSAELMRDPYDLPCNSAE